MNLAQEVFKDMVNYTHSVVAENRRLDIEKVRALADGSTVLGAMALEQGLIDRLGDWYDVKDYLGELIGSPIEVCW